MNRRGFLGTVAGTIAAIAAASREEAGIADVAQPAPKEGWLEELLPATDTTFSDHTAADCRLSVSNPEFYRDGDLIHVPSTGEHVVVTVTGVSSDNMLTVTRGFGCTQPKAIPSDDVLWIIGNAKQM